MHEANENNDCATLSLTLCVLHNNNNNNNNNNSSLKTNKSDVKKCDSSLVTYTIMLVVNLTTVLLPVTHLSFFHLVISDTTES